MTGDTEPHPDDETGGPEVVQGGQDEFHDANWTDVPAGDGFPLQHTGSNNHGAEADHLRRAMEQIKKQQEADQFENQSSGQNTTIEATVTDSTNQCRDTQDTLVAAKKRAGEAESELKKTEKKLSKALQRAEDAEAKVHELERANQDWATWAEQQQQVQQFSKNSRNTAATVVNLKKQLDDTKQKLDAHKADASVVQCRLGKTEKELLKALQRAKAAENERAGLFQMLNGATIQRDNRSPPGSFPDGDQITKMATKAAIFAWEYLMDISDFLKIDPLRAAKSGLWRAVKFAENAAEASVEKKKEHLAEFTEGEIPPEESLGHLFWKQTMQHVMKTKLDEPYDSFFVEWVGSDKKLKAIVEMDEKHKDELEERNIGAFMELHFKLRIACRFSDPECFLWPVVGTTVPFSSKHHNQQKTPDKRKRKAKAGESVLVVYPGLYFRNPEEPDCEPVVRAMVAVL